MLTASKWLLIIAAFWLIVDSVLIVGGIPNPLFGWPLPCPVPSYRWVWGFFFLELVVELSKSNRVFELHSGRRG